MIMFLISSTKKSTSESDLSVIKGKSDGKILPLAINGHCFAKKELKIPLFSLKSVINLLSWESGGIQGIFLNFLHNVLWNNVIKSDESEKVDKLLQEVNLHTG